MGITIKDVNYTYSAGTPYEKKAVDNMNIEIQDGEFIGLIGHTGSGKSTLIQQLNALLEPTTGDIFMDGENIFASTESKKEVRKNVGLVFQYPEHQLFELTVYKDIAFGPKNMGLEEEEIEKRVEEAMQSVGLSKEIVELSPFDLSGGQKRRVAIAGVLAMNPKVLILDEPTAGLDPYGRDQILDEIMRIHKERNITVILVSHSMEDVAKYVDRIIVLAKGKKIFDDTKYNVFKEEKALGEIGLDVPVSTALLNKLMEQGFPIQGTAITPEEAANVLLKVFGKEEVHSYDA